jgi:hypothetical protein
MCIKAKNGVFVLVQKKNWLSPKCVVHVGEVIGLLSAIKRVHNVRTKTGNKKKENENRKQ